MRFEDVVYYESYCSAKKLSQVHKYNKLIIHIHGGGFISMSSESHQNYTRLWSNELNVPIVSIDYRLAPKNHFPD